MESLLVVVMREILILGTSCIGPVRLRAHLEGLNEQL